MKTEEVDVYEAFVKFQAQESEVGVESQQTHQGRQEQRHPGSSSFNTLTNQSRSQSQSQPRRGSSTLEAEEIVGASSRSYLGPSHHQPHRSNSNSNFNYSLNSQFDLDAYLFSIANQPVHSVDPQNTIPAEYQNHQQWNFSFSPPSSSSYRHSISTLPTSGNNHQLDSTSFIPPEGSYSHQNHVGVAERSHSFSFGSSGELALALALAQQYEHGLQEGMGNGIDLNDSRMQTHQTERRRKGVRSPMKQKLMSVQNGKLEELKTL